MTLRSVALTTVKKELTLGRGAKICGDVIVLLSFTVAKFFMDGFVAFETGEI